MAQLVEQLIRNQQVAGSSPASSSIFLPFGKYRRVFYFIKGVKPIWLKVVISIAILGVTFGICCGIGYAIIAAAQQLL